MRSTLLSVAALTLALPLGQPVLADSPLQIRIQPTGVSADEARMWTQVILERPEVAHRLSGTRFRVLGSSFDAQPEKERTTQAGQRPFSLLIYDYTHNEAIRVEGALEALTELRIGAERSSESRIAPSPEEFEEALSLIRRHPDFRDRDEEYTPYPGMPATLELAEVPGDRIIAVGLMPTETRAFKHEIVAVNLSRSQVIRFPSGAPPMSLASDLACAPPNAGQATSGRGTEGQAEIVVQRPTPNGGSEEVWRMTAVRPAGSSGAYGSGIDLRNVTYRGKKILAQLHAPILNVHYDYDRCGPYRDWQWEENPFRATGTDFAPGFRQTSSPAQTIFDTGEDSGNYRGVAVYTQGTETIFVSEVSAGWYRYEFKVRLGEDGTITPTVGFAAIQDSCTCNRHHHNAYFRFDFDLGDGVNRVYVQNAAGTWSPVQREARFVKSVSARAWAVTDSSGRSGYSITPGESDGVADEFARGDAWALAFHPNEIDDSSVTGDAPIEIDSFVNDESVQNHDVVFWYGGHFTHAREPGPDSRDNHKVGPVLRPFTMSP